jgi:hypothetical protein
VNRREGAARRSSLWRVRALLALPVAFVSGCLLIAPPEDLPALGAGAQGGHGGSAGVGGADLGGTSSSFSGAGGDHDSGGEAGRASGGSGAMGGNGAAGGNGAVGGSEQGGGAPRGGDSTGANGGTTVGSAGEGGEGACSTNADCVRQNAGEAARCRPTDHTCVALKTPECPVAYAGDKGAARFADPNAIFVGSMVALDPDVPTTSPNAYALELAIDEINSKAGGLPDPDSGPPHPLVLLVCQSDTSQDADVVKRGIAHLGEDVQVQAVVTQLKPDDLFDAFNTEKGRKLVYLNAVAISSSLALNNGKLIWTLLGQPKDYAAAYKLLLSDLETYVRNARGLSSTDTIKVATVYTTDAFDEDLYGSVAPTLRFNDLPAESQPFDATHPDGKYLKVPVGSSSVDVQGWVDQIVAFAPDIVISAAGDAMTTSDGTNSDGIIQRVEAAMPSPRPYYILGPYNAGTRALVAVESVIEGEITSDATVAGRFMGVSAAAAEDLTLQNGFASRFVPHFSSSKEVAGQVDNYYDAVYYLAYATYAASLAGDTSGPGISAGMQRLIDGQRFDDGPDAIEGVFAALANKDNNIALYSTLGAPNFDPITGVRPATPGIFCFTWDAGFQMAEHSLDVLRYDAEAKAFTGNYECLANFAP